MKRKVIKVLVGIFLMLCFWGGLIIIGVFNNEGAPWWAWVLVLVPLAISIIGWTYLLNDYLGINEKH